MNLEEALAKAKEIEFANWVSCDKHGKWFAHTSKPKANKDFGMWYFGVTDVLLGISPASARALELSWTSMCFSLKGPKDAWKQPLIQKLINNCKKLKIGLAK